MYSNEQLEICLKNAYSIENRAKHEVEDKPTIYVGTVKREKRLYDIYEDPEKRYWYKNRIVTDKGIISEYEAIFGHPEERGGKKRERHPKR